MQLQFEKTALRCLGTALQEVQRSEVTQELRLPEGMPDIGRVLTTWGQVVIRSKQWQGNTIELEGGVKLWMLYAPEDGTEPRCMDSWLPVQIRWDVRQVDREGPMRMVPLLSFADSRCLSARKVMLRAGVSALVQALYPMEVETCTGGELPEDIQVLRRSYPVRLMKESGEKTFLMDEELTVPGGNVPVEKVFCVTANPEVTEKKVLSDKVVFKGNLNLHIVYRDQEGNVKSWDQAVPFSQLSELDQAYGTEAQADILMALTSLETDMAQPGQLRIKCGLVAQYLIDDRQVLEIVQDAYSVIRQVEPEIAALEIPVILDERTENLTLEQSLQGRSGRTAEGVLCLDFPRKREQGDSTELEVPGMFQTLVYDEHDSLQGMTCRCEGKIDIRSAENCRLMTLARPAGSVQAVQGMDAMELTSQIQLWIRSGAMERIPMVAALELGPVRDEDAERPSVILRDCRGDRLWDLAKSSSSTVEAICKANGIEENDTVSGMLLIPVL